MEPAHKLNQMENMEPEQYIDDEDGKADASGEDEEVCSTISIISGV